VVSNKKQDKARNETKMQVIELIQSHSWQTSCPILERLPRSDNYGILTYSADIGGVIKLVRNQFSNNEELLFTIESLDWTQEAPDWKVDRTKIDSNGHIEYKLWTQEHMGYDVKSDQITFEWCLSIEDQFQQLK